jgi:CHAT domain-containing protein
MFFYLSSFANFLYSAFRFSLTKRAKYLDDSISLLREVFQLELDDTQRTHFVTTQRLIECLNIRWQRDGCQHDSPDLDEVMDLFISGVNNTYAMAPDRLDLASHWANTARISGHRSLSTAYENAMSLMQSSLVFAPTLHTQHTRLVEKRNIYEKIPLNYASHHFRAGQLERAIEALEHGRAILWSEMRGLRTSPDRLRAADPLLAHRFSAINQELEILTTSTLLDGSREINDGGGGDEWMGKFSALMKRRHKLLTEQNALIPQIRSLPGLANFLLPPSFDTLRPAASRGPVIIINHCELGSDIIIVLHNSPPSHISTPSDFFDRANKLKDRLLSTRKQYGLNSKHHEDALFFVLKNLYELVGLPVVKRLNELGIAEQSRVWWCPTSVFWDLPLHAMGPIPSDGGVTRYFSDIYISSYTPTLSALLTSRRPVTTQTSARHKLLVSQPSKFLPGAWADTQAAQGLDLWTTILTSGDTTPTTVLDNLQRHQFAHIMGHVTPETAEPFDSAMSFHSGKCLTLLDIVRSQHPVGECALLLGSHTAGLTGDSIPDEVLHFSAAFQYSGFRSVVGTLWEVDDEDGKDLAGNIYRSIFSGEKGLEPYYERSARALQHALQQMRRDLPLVRWVNYVHFGA